MTTIIENLFNAGVIDQNGELVIEVPNRIYNTSNDTMM
jgi:hypothetical protein